MSRIKIGVVVFIIMLLTSCGTFEKVTTLNLNTNYFPAKVKKQELVKVLKKVSINADTLKTLLVVPTSDYWLQMGQNLNFFNEVLTDDQFESAIVKAGLSEKVFTVYDKMGLHRAYNIYKPFVILSQTKENKKGRWYAGLTLYDPKSAETIFENEIYVDLIWEGWTDQVTTYPLLNSLLDYLREQK